MSKRRSACERELDKMGPSGYVHVFGVCGHGPLCTRERCRTKTQLRLSRRDAKKFVEAVVNDDIHECPICKWQDGSHNSGCWIGVLAIKWREAEARTADVLATLADHGYRPRADLSLADAVRWGFAKEREALAAAAEAGAMLAREKDIVTAQLHQLREALEPFSSGHTWGLVKAWIVEGAHNRSDGLDFAKRLTGWQAKADSALKR